MGSLTEKELKSVASRSIELGLQATGGSPLFTDNKSGNLIVLEIERASGNKVHPLEIQVIETLARRRDLIQMEMRKSTIGSDSRVFVQTVYEAAMEVDPELKLFRYISLANDLMDKAAPASGPDLLSGDIMQPEIYGLRPSLTAVTQWSVILYNQIDKSRIPPSIEKLLTRVVTKTLTYEDLPQNHTYAAAIVGLLEQPNFSSERILGV